MKEGGALGLPFLHSPEAHHVMKFKDSWPANEMLKTVLRDQRHVLFRHIASCIKPFLELYRVNTQNITLRELVANSLYNLRRKRYAEPFPSNPEPEVRKIKEKRAVGRLKKTAAQREASSIHEDSLAEYRRLEKEVKDRYRRLQTYPEFSFDDKGFVRMPDVPPDLESDSREGLDLQPRAPSLNPSSQAHLQHERGEQSAKKRTAKRRKIVPRNASDEELEETEKSTEGVRVGRHHRFKHQDNQTDEQEAEEASQTFEQDQQLSGRDNNSSEDDLGSHRSDSDSDSASGYTLDESDQEEVPELSEDNGIMASDSSDDGRVRKSGPRRWAHKTDKAQ